MASFSKFNALVADLGLKVHNLNSDSLKVALCAAANAPVATNSVLGDLTEISYTNLSTRAVAGNAYSQTSGTAKLTATDLVLTASGGSVATFRYVVLYNDTAASKQLIGFWDYGLNVTLADTQTFTVDFSASNGIAQLA